MLLWMHVLVEFIVWVWKYSCCRMNSGWDLLFSPKRSYLA